MNCLPVLLFVALLVPGPVGAQERGAPTIPATRYGADPTAGRTFDRGGVRLYFEVYGAGEPLLLVHGNGGSIHDVAARIAHFREGYMVIAVDSRGHGKSDDGPGRLTYEVMADDLAALLDHLKVAPANVLRWSDGGIQALLLGMRHPAKVRRLAAMAANLAPTEEAIRPEVIALIRSMLAEIPEERRATPEGRRELRALQLLLEEPHIDPKALGAIAAPTLVLVVSEQVLDSEGGAVASFPCRTNMAHDIAVAQGPYGRYHHVAFALEDREDVKRASEAVALEGRPVEVPPSQHGITRGYTTYFRDPAGSRLEAFAGGYVTCPDSPTINWAVEDIGRGYFVSGGPSDAERFMEWI